MFVKMLPRLFAAGVFAIGIALSGLAPVAAQGQGPDSAAQQKPEVKKTVKKTKKRAVKPKARPAPKAKPTPRPKPKPVAMPRPQPERERPPEPAKTTPKQLLTAEQAATRYGDGLRAERVGDDHAALQAFLEAGESGYGPAQLKLGEVYDKGNSAVERDYATSLGWYQKAREQGIEVPRPHTFPGGR